MLEQRGFSATVFVATGVIDGDRDVSWYARQPPVLSWSDIVALDAGPVLSFEARLGRAVPRFFYPAGLYGERERALVARAGFSAATTCESDANTPASDPLALRRIAIDGGDRLADFRARLEGGHDRLSALRAAYRQVRFGRRTAR